MCGDFWEHKRWKGKRDPSNEQHTNTQTGGYEWFLEEDHLHRDACRNGEMKRNEALDFGSTHETNNIQRKQSPALCQRPPADEGKNLSPNHTQTQRNNSQAAPGNALTHTSTRGPKWEPKTSLVARGSSEAHDAPTDYPINPTAWSLLFCNYSLLERWFFQQHFFVIYITHCCIHIRYYGCN